MHAKSCLILSVVRDVGPSRRRQLFPKAQFIYMHRDPVDVFVSAANMADTTYWYVRPRTC